MFIVMNRFKVIKEECKAFEDVWLTRDPRLGEAVTVSRRLAKL